MLKKTTSQISKIRWDATFVNLYVEKGGHRIHEYLLHPCNYRIVTYQFGIREKNGNFLQSILDHMVQNGTFGPKWTIKTES